MARRQQALSLWAPKGCSIRAGQGKAVTSHAHSEPLGFFSFCFLCLFLHSSHFCVFILNCIFYLKLPELVCCLPLKSLIHMIIKQCLHLFKHPPNWVWCIRGNKENFCILSLESDFYRFSTLLNDILSYQYSSTQVFRKARILVILLLSLHRAEMKVCLRSNSLLRPLSRRSIKSKMKLEQCKI